MKKHNQNILSASNIVIAIVAVVALIAGICFKADNSSLPSMDSVDECAITAEFEGDLTPSEEAILKSGRTCAIATTNQSLIYSTRSDVMSLICFAVTAIGVMLLASNNSRILSIKSHK